MIKRTIKIKMKKDVNTDAGVIVKNGVTVTKTGRRTGIKIVSGGIGKKVEIEIQAEIERKVRTLRERNDADTKTGIKRGVKIKMTKTGTGMIRTGAG